MLAWLRGHESVLWWVGALSVVTFVGTLVALPLVGARLPADYFTQAPRPVRRRHAQLTRSRVLCTSLQIAAFPATTFSASRTRRR